MLTNMRALHFKRRSLHSHSVHRLDMCTTHRISCKKNVTHFWSSNFTGYHRQEEFIFVLYQTRSVRSHPQPPSSTTSFLSHLYFICTLITHYMRRCIHKFVSETIIYSIYLADQLQQTMLFSPGCIH